MLHFLEPLFYLIFINSVIIKLFADDTTFIMAEKDLPKCISKFKQATLSLVEWCDNNRLFNDKIDIYKLMNRFLQKVLF